jgi:hypothetical protein
MKLLAPSVLGLCVACLAIPGPSARGGQPTSEPVASSCDCDSTIYDPALKVQVPVVDAREEFKCLSEVLPQSNDATRTVAAQMASRRTRATKLSTRSTATNPCDDKKGSRSIGYWPKSDRDLTFTTSTASRHVIVFPNSVGGDFCTSLYQTSTNRSAKGTEAHIAFTAPNLLAFRIFDWSFFNNRHVREVPVCKMQKWVFPIRVGGFDRNGVLVVNETRFIKDTTWINCVYLGVFENGTLQRFDAVYSHSYFLDTNDEQQPSCCDGFWGPEIESFQDYKQPINAMGFVGCWMIQDGKSIPLDTSNTCKHDDGNGYGLCIFYKQPPLRDFLVH